MVVRTQISRSVDVRVEVLGFIALVLGTDDSLPAHITKEFCWKIPVCGRLPGPVSLFGFLAGLIYTAYSIFPYVKPIASLSSVRWLPIRRKPRMPAFLIRSDIFTTTIHSLHNLCSSLAIQVATCCF